MDPTSVQDFLSQDSMFIVQITFDGILTDINRAFLEQDKDEILGRSIFEYYGPEQQTDMRERIKRVALSALAESYSYTIFDEFKKLLREFYCTITAVSNKDLLCIYAIEVTQLSNVEGSLRNTEAKYQYLMEAATDGFITVDPYLKILDINISATRLLGVEGAELINRSLFNFMSQDQFERLPELLEQLETGGTERHEFHIESQKKRKIIIDVKITKLPNGNFLFLLYDVTYKLYQEDIAERTKSKIQQYKRLESLGVLAGGMAHEFNNILTPIMGYAELLYGDESNSDLQSKNIEQIIQGARRAKDLVEQILVFSRKKDTEKHRLDIHIIVKESIKLLRSSTPKEVTLNTHIENCSAIEANPSQIQQIIVQLASNALNAMNEKRGVLDIVLQDVLISDADEIAIPAGKYILLKVSDTGKGIEQTVIDRVFDPFFTTNDIGEGSGMGLSIVHGVVKSHGGEIFVDSQPNKGTTFSLYFPVKEAIKKTSRMSKKVAVSQNTSGREILILDDELEVVNLFEILLKRKGYAVSKFTSPLDALARFKLNPQKYDLIITDQTMPEMIGTDFSKEVSYVNSKVPILLLTGYSDLLKPDEMAEYNIKDILIKPVVPAVFYDIIDSILIGEQIDTKN